MMPKISVIISIYNAEKYIGECIESIISQKYRDFEVILVDDGSKDGSGIICDRYVAEDSRFKVIHQENRGISAARNAGLEKARGEYITFVDSDDCLAKDMFDQWMKAAVKYDADIVKCLATKDKASLDIVQQGESLLWRIYQKKMKCMINYLQEVKLTGSTYRYGERCIKGRSAREYNFNQDELKMVNSTVRFFTGLRGL